MWALKEIVLVDEEKQFEQIATYLDQADDHIWKHDEGKT